MVNDKTLKNQPHRHVTQLNDQINSNHDTMTTGKGKVGRGKSKITDTEKQENAHVMIRSNIVDTQITIWQKLTSTVEDKKQAQGLYKVFEDWIHDLDFPNSYYNKAVAFLNADDYNPKTAGKPPKKQSAKRKAADSASTDGPPKKRGKGRLNADSSSTGMPPATANQGGNVQPKEEPFDDDFSGVPGTFDSGPTAEPAPKAKSPKIEIENLLTRLMWLQANDEGTFNKTAHQWSLAKKMTFKLMSSKPLTDESAGASTSYDVFDLLKHQYLGGDPNFKMHLEEYAAENHMILMVDQRPGNQFWKHEQRLAAERYRQQSDNSEPESILQNEPQSHYFFPRTDHMAMDATPTNWEEPEPTDSLVDNSSTVVPTTENLVDVPIGDSLTVESTAKETAAPAQTQAGKPAHTPDSNPTGQVIPAPGDNDVAAKAADNAMFKALTNRPVSDISATGESDQGDGKKDVKTEDEEL